ncbi:DUF1810 domain-containing protein [Lysobacter korlensis]|uniref:DUF1810 domain-containing protein n=1 Tax=Lysobacter korlensis TaxID=553636 RepID=A0ABV6RQF2_9GAMM
MADIPDPHDLRRFVEAQDQGGVYENAVQELRRGRKQSHWMWFVFPQLRGLGSSSMAVRYGIASLDEARAYLAHPVLGPRLLECAEIVASSDGGSADAIFGPVDAVKLRSSMTLFAEAGTDAETFQRVLDRFFDGSGDR